MSRRFNLALFTRVDMGNWNITRKVRLSVDTRMMKILVSAYDTTQKKYSFYVLEGNTDKMIR